MEQLPGPDPPGRWARAPRPHARRRGTRGGHPCTGKVPPRAARRHSTEQRAVRRCGSAPSTVPHHTAGGALVSAGPIDIPAGTSGLGGHRWVSSYARSRNPLAPDSCFRYCSYTVVLSEMSTGDMQTRPWIFLRCSAAKAWLRAARSAGSSSRRRRCRCQRRPGPGARRAHVPPRADRPHRPLFGPGRTARPGWARARQCGGTTSNPGARYSTGAIRRRALQPGQPSPESGVGPTAWRGPSRHWEYSGSSSPISRRPGTRREAPQVGDVGSGPDRHGGRAERADARCHPAGGPGVRVPIADSCNLEEAPSFP